MKFENLKSFDSSLSFFQNTSWDGEIIGLCNIDSPKDDHLMFLGATKFLKQIKEQLESSNLSQVGLVIDKSFSEKLKPEDIEILKSGFLFLSITENLGHCMSWISKPFYDKKNESANNQVDGRQMGTAEVHPTAWISQNVFLGEGVKIGADVKIHSGVVILNGCEVGDNSEIYPNVCLYQNVKLGKNTRIHAGTIIGSDGFSYNFKDGVHLKVWHTGSVIIEDDVEIGSNCNIDQGTFSPTIIGAGTKFDNDIHIAHNVKVGKGCILCGNCSIAGSTTIGNYVVAGGGALIGPDLILGDACQLAGGAKVTSNWPANTSLGGHPARPLKEWLKGVAFVRKESLKK